MKTQSTYHIRINQDGSVVGKVGVLAGEMGEGLAALDREVIGPCSREGYREWRAAVGVADVR